MKLRSYHLLFRFFSFLSDKTNGFSLFARYKLALGTLIIGLTASSCANKGNTGKDDGNKKVDDVEVTTCYIVVGDVPIEEDTVAVVEKPQPPVIVIEEDTIESYAADCYMVVTEPIVKCYEAGAPTDTATIHKEDSSERVYVIVDTPPISPFGDLGQFGLWVHENVTYPQEVIDNGIQGRTTLKFVIDKDGSVTDVTVLRGIDPKLSEEFVRAVASSPKWQPGSHNGKPVKVSITIPFMMPRFSK